MEYKFKVPHLVPNKKKMWEFWNGTKISFLIELMNVSFNTQTKQEAISAFQKAKMVRGQTMN
jgi:hypothetical protein